MSARDDLAAWLIEPNGTTADALLDAYRDEILTEAAQLAGGVIGPLWHLDTLHEISGRILAARTTQGS